eukprot:15280129-Alexandrium_andersonii.AAC.1
MYHSEDQEDYEPMTAAWGDGSTRPIPQLTIGDWKAMPRGRVQAAKSLNLVLYHSKTQNKLE